MSRPGAPIPMAPESAPTQGRAAGRDLRVPPIRGVIASEVEWATGRELCVHLFRHVIAHEVEHATGRSTAAAVFLGHDARQQHGTVWVYATDGTFAEAAEIAAACYGWPDRWPTALPEWSLLARALGLDPGAES